MLGVVFTGSAARLKLNVIACDDAEKLLLEFSR